MKKYLLKFTTLVLIVAMLVPFVSIPKVKADTSNACDGGEWEYHTNYYFFLQAETPFSWAEMFNNSNGTATTYYYTGFLYNFPSDGSAIEFEDDGFVNITSGGTAVDNFNAGSNRTNWSAAQFYKELQLEDMSSVYGNNLKEYVYQNNATGTENDRIVSYLFHGDWAFVGDESNPNDKRWDLNNLDIQSLSLNTNNSGINELTNSSILLDVNKASTPVVEIGSGTLSQGSGISLSTSQLQQAIKNFNNGVGEGTAVAKYNSSSEPVINMIIKRTYSLNDIFNTSLTITQADAGVTKDESTGSNSAGSIKAKINSDEEKSLWLPDKENESIRAENAQGQELSIPKTIKLNNEYWFLAPTLYQMSYRVCKANNEEGTVVVSYDGNADNVTNVPNSDTVAYGSAYTVSNQKPSREGYAFKNWNTSANCDGTIIEPGAKLSDNLTNNVTLYACWGSTGSGEQKQTGIIMYTGLFGGLAALAGGAYYLVKKKNLFKKI